jgi:hypothetical protein
MDRSGLLEESQSNAKLWPTELFLDMTDKINQKNKSYYFHVIYKK